MLDHPEKRLHIADSALEDRQVKLSRTAPISVIPVRSPSHASEGCDGPADHRLLAALACRSRLLGVRDEEPAGSNPATPTGKQQVTRYLVACRSHDAFPNVRFWSQHGNGGPSGPRLPPPGCPYPRCCNTFVTVSRARLLHAKRRAGGPDAVTRPGRHPDGTEEVTG